MASKVLVKMPTVSFNSQVGKKCGGGELVVGRSEGLLLPSMSSDPLLHIAQLEQNIRWLHEQHQVMLSALHQEIEVLRQRNRDLQFRLIFSEGGIAISHSSSDSSPEDKNTVVLSLKECNTQTLQVEMLEKELLEVKAALAEANSINTTLTNTVEQQKKRLMSKEASWSTEADCEIKLDEADKIINRIRRDNDELKKEITSLRGAMKNMSGGGGRHSGGRRGGQPHDQHRFPPLHSQSYWHHSQQRSKTSPDYQSQPSGGGGGHRRDVAGASGVGEAASLPHLSRNYSQPSGSNGNRSRYYNSGNHYYSHRGGGNEAKYRGRREPRDPSQ